MHNLQVCTLRDHDATARRLQPSAIVTDEDCAACEFNKPGKTCMRPMSWVWRGETFSATASEYYSIKGQLQAGTRSPRCITISSSTSFSFDQHPSSSAFARSHLTSKHLSCRLQAAKSFVPSLKQCH